MRCQFWRSWRCSFSSLPEGQPVAVYALGSKLTLLQDFTSDPQVLKKIVKNMKHEISPLTFAPA
ncbi:MAG TPA: hypothetical protein VNW97_03235 [Candidatus Saccharimonadales bacterium]|nr:hypothetical protein [Candidatus Saccharimonadales bacterium]